MKTYKGTIPEIELKYKKGDTLKCKITSSKDAADLFMKLYDQDVFELTESVIVIYLNTANNTIGWMKHSSGGTNQTIVEPKLIVAAALKMGASSVILSHNHPSGNILPSIQDQKITEKLKEGCNYFNIRLLDHIIVATDSYYSFGDEGEI